MKLHIVTDIKVVIRARHKRAKLGEFLYLYFFTFNLYNRESKDDDEWMNEWYIKNDDIKISKNKNGDLFYDPLPRNQWLTIYNRGQNTKLTSSCSPVVKTLVCWPKSPGSKPVGSAFLNILIVRCTPPLEKLKSGNELVERNIIENMKKHYFGPNFVNYLLVSFSSFNSHRYWWNNR